MIVRYRTIWISDIHLGTRPCDADALVAFLEQDDADYLYLVGDIIDFWSRPLSLEHGDDGQGLRVLRQSERSGGTNSVAACKASMPPMRNTVGRRSEVTGRSMGARRGVSTSRRAAAARRPRARRPAASTASIVQAAINSSEIIAVGVLTIVRSTLVPVLSSAKDLGAEDGIAVTTAVRASIKAAYAIGADLGAVAHEAVRGTITAAADVGGELTAVARSAARSAVNATADVGGDVAVAAHKAIEGGTAAGRKLAPMSAR